LTSRLRPDDQTSEVFETSEVWQLTTDKGKSMGSSATDFFTAAATRRIEPIAGLDQWKIRAFMRSMTAREKDDFEASVLTDELDKVDDERLKTAKARLVIACVCDEKGSPLFTDADLDRVRGLDSKVIEIIHRQVNSHVGFDRGDLERLLKNSEAVRAVCSPSS